MVDRSSSKPGALAVVMVMVMAMVVAGTGAPSAASSFPGANGKIAFTTTRDTGGQSIWTMNPDGSNPTQLTHDVLAVDPTWSADGSKIAYTRLVLGALTSAIWVMDADGGNQAELFRSDTDYVRSPSWSPDGTKIVFEHYENSADELGLTTLWTIDADGSNPTALTAGSCVPGQLGVLCPQDGHPSWSPDGMKIAYLHVDPDGTHHISVMDANGENAQVLVSATDDVGWVESPSWSPDGTRIIFQDRTKPAVGPQVSRVRVMNADGSNLVTLYEGVIAPFPAFSPDGTQIAVTAQPEEGGEKVFVMNADGSNPVMISPPDPVGQLSIDRTSAGSWQPIIGPAVVSTTTADVVAVAAAPRYTG